MNSLDKDFDRRLPLSYGLVPTGALAAQIGTIRNNWVPVGT